MSLNILKATLDNLENERKKTLIEIDLILNRSNTVDGQKKVIDKLTELFINLSNVEGAMRIANEVILENIRETTTQQSNEPTPPPSQIIKEGEEPKDK